MCQIRPVPLVMDRYMSRAPSLLGDTAGSLCNHAVLRTQLQNLLHKGAAEPSPGVCQPGHCRLHIGQLLRAVAVLVARQQHVDGLAHLLASADSVVEFAGVGVGLDSLVSAHTVEAC